MYSAAKYIFRQNFWYILFIVLSLLVCKALVEIGMPSGFSDFYNFASFAILSYFIVTSSLFGTPFAAAFNARPGPWRRLVRFLLQYVAILSVAVIPLIAFLLMWFQDEAQRRGEALITHLFQLAGQPLVFALLGTWLAAAIYDLNPRFSDALRRSRRVFLPLIWRLLLIAFIDFFLRVVFAILHSAFAHAPKAMVFADDGSVNVGTSIGIVLIYLIDAYALVFANVAIGRQFLKAEGNSLPLFPSARGSH